MPLNPYITADQSVSLLVQLYSSLFLVIPLDTSSFIITRCQCLSHIGCGRKLFYILLGTHLVPGRLRYDELNGQIYSVLEVASLRLLS